MIVGYYNTDIGVVCGKIKLKNFLQCLLTANKSSLEKIMVTLYPIKEHPFYKDYKFLLAPQEDVTFKIKERK